jgi:hypothetical protein
MFQEVRVGGMRYAAHIVAMVRPIATTQWASRWTQRIHEGAAFGAVVVEGNV